MKGFLKFHAYLRKCNDWRGLWQFSEIYVYSTCACTKSMAAGARSLMFQESSRSVFAYGKSRLSEGRPWVRYRG